MKKISVLSLVFLISCSSPVENKRARHINSMLAEDELDPKFEFYEEGSRKKEKAIHAILSKFSIDMLKSNRKAHKGFSKIPRDAHAKSHGCLKAKFIINNEKLNDKHQLGIFAENKKEYDSYLRFSNNDHLPVRKDGKLDMRGMAIKLLGVSGDKVMRDYEHETTQDFLMYGSNRFFIKNNRDYIPFIQSLRDGIGPAIKGTSLKSKAILAKALTDTRAKQFRIRNKKNPLGIKYFSATPIRLGEADNPDRVAIKYAASPCEGYEEVNISNKDAHDYMRNNLIETLKKKGKACFDFKVQIQNHPEVMPIEDSTKAWPEKPKKTGRFNINGNKFSPYLTVAKVHVEYNEKNKELLKGTRQDQEFCEDLSFSPWHTISAHKPLGRTMRMRRDLYRDIADFRRKENKASFEEPAD